MARLNKAIDFDNSPWLVDKDGNITDLLVNGEPASRELLIQALWSERYDNAVE